MKVAITGGIGSGKSTVISIIREMGYPAFSCDEIYAELLSDEAFCLGASEAVGVPPAENAGEKTLDRAAVSARVFTDPEARKRLEDYTHPKIMAELIRRMEKFPLSFAEVPLLFEGGFEKMFDRTIIVMRDESDRIESLVKTRSMDRENIIRRIKNQYDYEKNGTAGHTVIYNGFGLAELKKTVESVVREIEMG